LDDEYVYQAMKDADLTITSLILEHKFETVLGERGITLPVDKTTFINHQSNFRSPTTLSLLTIFGGWIRIQRMG
jgi:hypothetical protein